MGRPDRIVVAGASLAGLSAANTLRGAGYEGEVSVIDASPHLPSDRPPLSKGVLSGATEPEAATQPLAKKLEKLDVELRLHTTLTSLDPESLTVATIGPDGRPTDVTCAGVVIATGAAPVTFGLDATLGGVHVLRTLDDSLSLKAAFDEAPSRVVVIGAGFIGAEVAATARGCGLDVTMLEAAPLPMSRAIGPAVGEWVTDLHRSEGVDVRLGQAVSSIDGIDAVSSVSLADGTVLDADVVVIGIGVAPNTSWLDSSGLDLTDGVTCDATLAAAPAAPGVVAAGDVASWYNPLFGERMRVEHWDLAIEAGRAAGARLLADLRGEIPVDFSPVPWFWSHQYDAKIQMVGRCSGTDEAIVLERDDATRSLVVAFRRDDRCVAILGVNRPRIVVKARMAMAKSLQWSSVLEALG